MGDNYDFSRLDVESVRGTSPRSDLEAVRGEVQRNVEQVLNDKTGLVYDRV